MTGFDLSTISDVYVGSTQYSSIYKGSIPIWTATPPYDAEIEYIEGTGTQYINTEIIVTQYPIKLDTEIYPTNSSDEKSIMGNKYANSQSSYVITYGIYKSKFFMWAGSSSWLLASGTANANNWYNIQFECPDVNSRAITINGTQYTSTLGNGNATSNTHPLYLMYEGNITSKIYKGKMKYAKIYIGNQLVRDFIPVRVGTVGYMYDKVSKRLFGNSGSGDFVLGQDKTV